MILAATILHKRACLIAVVIAVVVTQSTTVSNLTSPRLSDYEIMRSSAQSHGFTMVQIERLWMRESLRDDSAIGRHGEIGRGQIKLSTARIYDTAATKAKLHDSLYNMQLTLTYLRDLKNQMGGNRTLAFAAYNRGPGRVLSDLKNKRNPVNRYAHFVAGE